MMEEALEWLNGCSDKHGREAMCVRWEQVRQR